MTQFSVTGSHVVVVGAARSGLAAAALAARRGARVTVSEARPAAADAAGAAGLRSLGVAMELGGHRPATFDAADLIVLSPGVSPRIPVVARARAAGVPVISEIELAARWLRGRLVAVTGTKGKSTTTALSSRMLDTGGHRTVVGGNIGRALSSQVDDSTPDVIHVVEVSSFQLELTATFRPWIAVCLNLSPDHLDRHGNLEEYARAKARIFANQTSEDAMVINADDPRVLEMARGGRARPLRFTVSRTLSEGVHVTAGAIAHRSGGRGPAAGSAVRRPVAGPASVERRGGGGGRGHPCGRRPRCDDARRAVLRRPRAHARVRCRAPGCPLRQRLEGDESGRGASGDRVLRPGPRRDPGRPVQGWADG